MRKKAHFVLNIRIRDSGHVIERRTLLCPNARPEQLKFSERQRNHPRKLCIHTSFEFLFDILYSIKISIVQLSALVKRQQQARQQKYDV